MSPGEAEALRHEIWTRQIDLRLKTDWLTPTGRRRASPSFSATIRNEYLGASKALKASSQDDVVQKARGQYEAWNRDEFAKRAAEQAQADLESVQALLLSGLTTDRHLKWDSLVDVSEFAAFEFLATPPT